MSKRASLITAAAIATLATAALATSASALPIIVHGGGGIHGIHIHPGPICSWGCGHDHDHDHDGRWWGFRRPIVEGAVASVGVNTAVTSAPVSAPAPAVAPTGGCLTKRELPDGSALFRDKCTGEAAESAPEGAPPGQR